MRYAVREGKSLAFEVFGRGPCDVIVFQIAFPIDLMWELPELASFMETLGGFARVIVFDGRGYGASDPFADPGAATLETACDDLLAVLDAAGSERATVFDMATGVEWRDFRGDLSGSGSVADRGHIFARRFRSSAVCRLEQRRAAADVRGGIEGLQLEALVSRMIRSCGSGGVALIVC